MKGKFFHRLSTFVLGAVIATSFAFVPSATLASADPDTAREAKAELDRIREESAAVDAEFSASAERLAENRKTQERLAEELVVQRQVVADSMISVSQVARANYQSSGLGPAVSLLTSPDDSAFLSSMATRQSVNARTNAQLQNSQVEQARLANLETEAKQAEESIKAETAKQEKLLKEYERKEAEMERIYNRLSAQERSRLAQLEAAEAATRQAQIEAREAANSRSAVGADIPASGRGGEAVSFAYAQVGKTYRSGATGPNSYDCSGLTYAAYKSVGISIPRTSQAQFRTGTPVAAADLQPGDLVFYYSGISHVGIYIGNGQIVHAANPRRGINVTGLYSMPYMGARRVA